MSELYNELRQVHRRLELDLRGVRDMELPNAVLTGRAAEAAGKFAIDVQTYVRSDNAERVNEMEIRTDALVNDDAIHDDRRVDVVESQEYEKDRGRYRDRERGRSRGMRGKRKQVGESSLSLRDTTHSRSGHVEDNDYLGLHDVHSLEVQAATERSPDMFCLAPLDRDGRKGREDDGGHRNRAMRRRERRRSGGRPEEYRQRETHPRRTSLDKRER